MARRIPGRAVALPFKRPPGVSATMPLRSRIRRGACSLPSRGSPLAVSGAACREPAVGRVPLPGRRTMAGGAGALMTQRPLDYQTVRSYSLATVDEPAGSLSCARLVSSTHGEDQTAARLAPCGCPPGFVCPSDAPRRARPAPRLSPPTPRGPPTVHQCHCSAWPSAAAARVTTGPEQKDLWPLRNTPDVRQPVGGGHRPGA
jgi:hypothetical protein